MLYVTTRSDRDAYTAHKVLRESIAPDGGLYLPMRFPKYEASELQRISELGFSSAVAELLNAFFVCNLTGWDVEFSVGRNAVKLVTMKHRITVAELWHNTTASYNNLLLDLYNSITGSKDAKPPSDWFIIAVRIAVLFGIYSEMCKQEVIDCGGSIDISVPANSFAVPIAAHYARYMGLPISTIVCTCNNSTVWDFLQLGELSTASVDSGTLSRFERLLSNRFSQRDLLSFLNTVNSGKSFALCEEKLPTLNQGYFCIVVSDTRADQSINSIFRSTQYIADPECAICIAGLRDYRAKTGVSRPTVIFSDVSPLESSSDIERATGISALKLQEYLNH